MGEGKGQGRERKRTNANAPSPYCTCSVRVRTFTSIVRAESICAFCFAAFADCMLAKLPRLAWLMWDRAVPEPRPPILIPTPTPIPMPEEAAESIPDRPVRNPVLPLPPPPPLPTPLPLPPPPFERADEADDIIMHAVMQSCSRCSHHCTRTNLQ